MKKEVTLRFSSIKSLCLFWSGLSGTPYHISLHTKTITQSLTKEEVDLAVKKYNAEIIDTPKAKL
jgi:hypothetical protein